MKYNAENLIPAIVQHAATKEVLMLGYMNAEAFERTKSSGYVTFFSRSRNALWMKGETSGNVLKLVDWKTDCDEDTLLVRAIPEGPVCHNGTSSCWGNTSAPDYSGLTNLLETIENRFSERKEESYIQSLLDKGLPKIAQKVGEESVELVIEAMRDEPQLFKEEAADLFFHYLILLRAKETKFEEILTILASRSKKQ